MEIKNLTDEDLLIEKTQQNLMKLIPAITGDEVKKISPEKLLAFINDNGKNLKDFKSVRELERRVLALTKPISKEDFIGMAKNYNEGYRTGYLVQNDREKEIVLSASGITFIAAPTKHGKTTLMFNLLLETAKKYPEEIHYFISYEENKLAVITKMLVSELGEKLSENTYRTLLNYVKTGKDQYVNKDFRPITKNPNFIKKVDDFFTATMKNVRVIYGSNDVIELLKAIGDKGRNKKTGCVFIDYMQIIPYEAHGISRFETIKLLCSALKDLAIEKELALVIASQFNREVRNPDEMTPQNLSEGSDIEKVANRVYALWNFKRKYKYPKNAFSNSENEFKKLCENQTINKNIVLLTLMLSRDSETFEGIFKADYNLKKINPLGKEVKPLLDGLEEKSKKQDNLYDLPEEEQREEWKKIIHEK